VKPWRFFARLIIVYAIVVMAVVLAINPYFSVGWDAQIFASVGRAIIDNKDIFDLYQASRQTWGDWGFPYPPLYAHLLAPFIGITYLAPLLPDWLIVRVPPVIFDTILAYLVYLLIRRRSSDERLARLGAILWLFNPLTLYQTAIQAHQESTWLVCVVLAYALMQSDADVRDRGGNVAAKMRHWQILPSLLMALAVAFKQSAILFYIPYVTVLFLDRDRRWPSLVAAGAIFALIFGGLSLPYYLHSPDYFYLVFVDVSNMPVQTQSAVVWLLGLKDYLLDQTRSTFVLLKYQVIITLGLAGLVSVMTLQKDRDLFRSGLLMALLFFLTSRKVMGYHYPLLVPFLLIYTLPDDRFDLLGIGMIAASWIILSPYYAPWAKPEHMALYAAIGTPNTLLWLWMLVHVWRRRRCLRIGNLNVTGRLRDGGAVVIATCIMTLGMILSSLVQPWAANPPLVQIVLFALVFTGSLIIAVPVARRIWSQSVRIRPAHVILAGLLIPVYFAAFALTAESTRIIESILPL